MVGDTIHGVLERNETFTASQFEQYGKDFKDGIETMRKIVYAFYDENFSFGNSSAGHGLQGDLTDCLISNIANKDFSYLFKNMGELADLPEPVSYGQVKSA